MKRHYDFSRARQGKLFRPARTLRPVPIYLDEDVQSRLIGAENRAAADVSKLVNEILRSQIGLLEMLK